MELLISIVVFLFLTGALLFILLLSSNRLIKEQRRTFEESQRNKAAERQGAQVAEYLALARRLSDTSPESDYRRANQLSWELAMWLPEQIYKEMTAAIANPGPVINELSVTIAVRKFILGEKAGELGPNDIAHHAPGVGRKTTLSEEQVV